MIAWEPAPLSGVIHEYPDQDKRPHVIMPGRGADCWCEPLPEDREGECGCCMVRVIRHRHSMF